MTRCLRDLRGEVRLLLGRLVTGVRRWIDPLAGTDEVRYKSSKEIALENAAEAIGQTLGDYYPDTWEVPSLEQDAYDIPPEIRARADAAREEMLVYVDRIAERRRRRHRVRRVRIAVLALSLVGLVVGGLTLAWALLRSPGADERGIPPAGSVADSGRPRPPDIAKEHQQEPFANSVSLALPEASSEIVANVFPNTEGAVCARVSESRIGVLETSALGSCLQPKFVERRLAGDCAMFGSGGGYGERIFIVGFAHRKVVDIVGRAPSARRPLRIRLGPVWTPSADGEKLPRWRPMRVFLLTAQLVREKIVRGRSDPLSGVRGLDPYTYRLTARLRDGRSARVRGFLQEEIADGPGCGP